MNKNDIEYIDEELTEEFNKNEDTQDQDDSALLDEIEDEVENEKPEKAKEKKEKKPFKLSKQGIGTLIFFAAAAVIAVAMYNVNQWRLSRIVPVEPTEVKSAWADDPYSKENIKGEINDGLLGAYKFLLYGDYHAVTDLTDSGEADFSFGEEDQYFGYSSNEPDDFGTYTLAAVKDKIVLTINCTGTTDTYDVTLSDEGNVVLTAPDNTKFVLYE